MITVFRAGEEDGHLFIAGTDLNTLIRSRGTHIPQAAVLSDGDRSNVTSAAESVVG